MGGETSTVQVIQGTPFVRIEQNEDTYLDGAGKLGQ